MSTKKRPRVWAQPEALRDHASIGDLNRLEWAGWEVDLDEHDRWMARRPGESFWRSIEAAIEDLDAQERWDRAIWHAVRDRVRSVVRHEVLQEMERLREEIHAWARVAGSTPTPPPGRGRSAPEDLDAATSSIGGRQPIG